MVSLLKHFCMGKVLVENVLVTMHRYLYVTKI